LHKAVQQGSKRWRAASSAVDAAEYNRQRLAADAAARDRMRDLSAAEQAAAAASPPAGEEAAAAPPPGAWKWEIRKRIWDLMEEQNIADFPRPVHHRIPNFKGAAEAAAQLSALPEFQAAACVKCNPDTPQKQVRPACACADKLGWCHSLMLQGMLLSQARWDRFGALQVHELSSCLPVFLSFYLSPH
jgi:5-formyltetrahydrofolate cyclo-ligase